MAQIYGAHPRPGPPRPSQWEGDPSTDPSFATINFLFSHLEWLRFYFGDRLKNMDEAFVATLLSSFGNPMHLSFTTNKAQRQQGNKAVLE